MQSIRDDVRARELLVADGAWGTLLIEEGLDAGACPELWNVEHPDVVESIARRYIEAGAELITTNTFGGNRCKLERSYGQDVDDGRCYGRRAA